MVQPLILQRGQEIQFHPGIYNVKGVIDHIDGAVLNDVITRGRIGGIAINLWIRHLYHDEIVGTDRMQRFIFVSPHLFDQHRGRDLKAQSNELRDCFMLRATPNKLFLVPYNIGALTAYRGKAGLTYSRRNDPANSYTWRKIMCPFQPNDNDCGYYVMKFMKDVVTHRHLVIPMKYYEDARCAELSDHQMDEIIEEWCEYMVKQLVSLGM